MRGKIDPLHASPANPSSEMSFFTAKEIKPDPDPASAHQLKPAEAIVTPFLDAQDLREHKQRNLIHSIALIGGISAILAAATSMIWGVFGVVSAFVCIGIVAFSASRIPPDAVMKLYRARHVPPDDSQLSYLVDELAMRAELPARPELYVIPSATLNAFATGSPDRSAIAITEGLLRRLTLREINGVIAHEMSHIRNNDLWLMGLADVMTRFVTTLSYVAIALAVMNLFGSMTGEPAMSWFAVGLLYLAPALMSLLQLGLSRAREFDADLEAAMLTGDPVGLASALKRLEHYTGSMWEDLSLPVPSRKVPQPSLLRTHPPTEDRVARLLSLKPERQMPPITIHEEPMVTLVGIGPAEMRPRYRWPAGLWY